MKALKDSKDREEKHKTEEQDRKKNEMNKHEIRIALAIQAKNLMVETKKNSGKKIVMKMETIQLFSKLEISEFPKNKEDIDRIIAQLDDIIKNEESMNNV